MRWVIVLLLCVACAPTINFRDFKKKSAEHGSFIQWNHFAIDADTEPNFLLEKSPKTSLKTVREHLVMVRSPLKETLKEQEIAATIPLSVSKTDKKNVIEIKPKSDLLAGSTYGFYWQDKSSHNFDLIYTFLAKRGPPRIVNHDLSENEPNVISEGRVLFLLTFDQPIILRDDQAITLQNLTQSANSPPIENLTVLMDRKTIKIKLAHDTENKLIADKKYAFVFSKSLTNLDNVSSNLKPLEFTVTKAHADFKEVEPLALSASHNSVEMTWFVNQAHRTELFIEEADVTNPKNGTVFSSKANFHKSLDRFHVTGLNEENSFRFVLRSEYYDGRILALLGDFKTMKSAGIFISEIMVNPNTNGQKDQRGEFIEMVNLSDKDQAIDGLYMSVEDIGSHKISNCPLSSFAQNLLIAKNGYFIIVSSEFDESLYSLPKDTVLVRLQKKTLCGGLADSKQKIIKIYRDDGHYIDRYGGYLWASRVGQSIQRINPMGLDDMTNYCYSQPSRGPTPGRKNGPCG